MNEKIPFQSVCVLYYFMMICHICQNIRQIIILFPWMESVLSHNWGRKQKISINIISQKQRINQKLQPTDKHKQYLIIVSDCWMSKKEQIQYQDPMSRSYSDLSQFRLSLSSTVDVSQNFNENIAEAKQQTQLNSESMKKYPKLASQDTYYAPEFTFNISIELINLLRNPTIVAQSYDPTYLKQLHQVIHSLAVEYHITGNDRIYLIYVHLVFAKISNLQDFKELGDHRENIVPISKEIERVNILNPHCLLANLKLYDNQNVKAEKCQVSDFTIQVIFQRNVCQSKNDRLALSMNYLDKAINSHGEYDLHFSSFVAHKLNFSPLLHYFAYCNKALDISVKYAELFAAEMDDSVSKQTNYQQWYEEQVQRIIQGEFSMEDVRTKVINGERNDLIEKLLIGLLGWSEKTAEQATILLNVFYDKSDWQFSSPFKPVISQVGQDFEINYLIENRQQNRKNLILCLKAPCTDKNYRQQVFSWHHLKIKQYASDDDTYLWINISFQKFKTCGFHDWKLFQLSKEGNKEVHKIVNLSDEKKLSKSQQMNENIYSVRPVQGRFIVHPENSRKLQIHQIYMDSLSCMEGSNRIPTFSDAAKDITRYAEYGINCSYLMGVFQRDSGKFASGFKRPQASPMALTSRTSPCGMLGGEQSFKQLMKKSQEVGMKIITDCTDRISSSRYDKIYDPYILNYIDQSGRKFPFYGCQGRSINYQDTMMLNYRKLEAWNLLIDEASEVISKYGINGIYLDNGISWPQLYEIDHQQMLRKDRNNRRFYKNTQIFEGQVILKNKHAGYWVTKNSLKYPNPFYIKLAKTLWQRFDGLLMICQSFEIADNDERGIMVIHSGLIPRVYKMTKAVAQIMGMSLHQNGSIGKIEPKTVTLLKKWYEQIHKFLPEKAILIQSTSSHAWPYPAFIFKKATWAFVDLIFFLPEIPMTFIGEHDGKAYRTKTTSIFFDSVKKKGEKNSNSYIKRVNSSFFNQNFSNSQQKIISSVNATVKDPTQIKYLQDAFRRQVGPEFGFDLAEIYQHYKHRRKLRAELSLLTSGKMIALTAEHNYGVHKNILSFAKWNNSEMLIISINFNETKVDMHYNFNNLKYIFTKPFRSNLVLELEVIMGKTIIKNNLFTVSQLITSRIETTIQGYQSIIWRIKINKTADIDQVYQHSVRRMIDQINSTPPRWIYSSIFTNQVSNMLDTTRSLKSFVGKLQFLYEKFILPNNINFSLVISKTHEFWLNRNKLSKLFGVFKLIQKYPELNASLKSCIKLLVEGNSLGPIAFVTPEIGVWSSVGGLGVMVDELSKQLAKIGEQVYLITPYYQYNKKKQTNYLARDGFKYDRNIKVQAAHFIQQFGIHTGKYHGVNYIWFHNPQLFSKPYDGQGALYVSKQLVFFALATLEIFCQLKIFPSIIATNDWMCGFVSAYVKVGKYSRVFDGTKFMHIVHNLDPLYEGRLYPKFEQGDLNWLIQLPSTWYVQYKSNKLIINPSRCALETCDNWGTVSNSYKYDLLKESPLAPVLWKYPNPFSFPNGVRKDQRVSFIKSKTPGNHLESKKILQEKYFGCTELKNDIPILAFIGRITKQKGVHLIVDCAEQLLYEFNFKIQFLVGGGADYKQQYGKYCAQRLKQLSNKYPKCFWSNPDLFFTDGPLANIGSDFALMPSLFEPGGIVQHQFFCGGTPVVAFRTGGLKDTVFEYDYKTQKGNGFNFMSYDAQDFKRCLRRAIECYKNKTAYDKLRQNAFDSVIEEEDVAKGWNTEFYRLQNKVYIDWNGVEKEIESLVEENNNIVQDQQIKQIGEKGEFWCEDWDIRQTFKAVLLNAQRLKGKQVKFVYETEKIPRPKDVSISGSWDQWKEHKKMKFDRTKKNWVIGFKLKPGTYYYKYYVDDAWTLNKSEEIQIDLSGNENHIIVVQ